MRFSLLLAIALLVLMGEKRRNKSEMLTAIKSTFLNTLNFLEQLHQSRELEQLEGDIPDGNMKIFTLNSVT